MQSPVDPSYRALLGIPTLGRILVGMALGRTAAAMVSVALILFTLERFHSPVLAGIVTFVSIVPGLLVSPVVGALLDRHGRTRLVILDHLVAAASFALIGTLAAVDALSAPWLVAIASVAGLTAPLSATGLRTLFPLLVPRRLWGRVNAIDSNGYVVATLVGPPLAGILLQAIGGAVTIVIIGGVFVAASVAFLGAADPRGEHPDGRLLADAWDGVRYTVRNPILRALGISLSVLNLGSGILTIAIPIIVIERLGLGEAVVGVGWSISAVAGGVAALVFGRWSTEGRERTLLVRPMLGMAVAIATLLLPPSLAVLFGAMAAIGFLNGPLDVTLFTLRQRATEPRWIGRAFAVSMALNFAGYPVGAAIAGVLVATSLELALGFALAVTLLAAAVAGRLLPRIARETIPEPAARATDPCDATGEPTAIAAAAERGV